MALGRGAYLTANEAARYLGFTLADYRDPRAAFMRIVERHRIPILWTGKRARFFVGDLDTHAARFGRASREGLKARG